MENFIIFICVATVIGLVAFVVLHKEEGVRQKVKVYGLCYYLKTFVYINGKVYGYWEDKIDDDDEYIKIRKKRRKEAEELYDSLMFKK